VRGAIDVGVAPTVPATGTRRVPPALGPRVVAPGAPGVPAVVNVVVGDDGTLVGEGLVSLLSAEPGFHVVARVSTLAEARRALRGGPTHLVVVAGPLGTLDALRAGETIRAEFGRVAVVLMAEQSDPETVARAMAAGCAGFLTADRGRAEVLLLLRAAARGQVALSADQLHRLLTHLSPRPARPSDLSSRELDVLVMMADGVTTDEMARRLFISAHTVRNRVRSVLSKLGAHSKLEAVAVATREGIIRID